MLLNMYFDFVVIPENSENNWGCNQIVSAVRTGDIELLEAIWATGLPVRYFSLNTHSLRDHEESYECATGSHPTTPLTEAINVGSIGMCEWLYAHGVRPRIQQSMRGFCGDDDERRTPDSWYDDIMDKGGPVRPSEIHDAVESGWVELVDWVLIRGSQDICNDVKLRPIWRDHIRSAIDLLERKTYTSEGKKESIRERLLQGVRALDALIHGKCLEH